LTQLVSMMRRVRRAIPAVAAVSVGAHDYEQPGKPAFAWDDPTARVELVTGLVNDARASSPPSTMWRSTTSSTN
jgi:hypothetical protein